MLQIHGCKNDRRAKKRSALTTKHTVTRNLSEMKPISLVHYGDISAHLNQSMSKTETKTKTKTNKNKKQTNKQKKNKENTRKNTHSSLGQTGPDFAFGRNF